MSDNPFEDDFVPAKPWCVHYRNSVGREQTVSFVSRRAAEVFIRMVERQGGGARAYIELAV